MAVMIAEVLLSLLAVFGLYAAVRLFLLQPSRSFASIAIELRAPLTPQEAEMRIAIARKQFLLEGYPIVLLVDAVLLEDASFLPLLEAVDACFVVEDETKEM